MARISFLMLMFMGCCLGGAIQAQQNDEKGVRTVIENFVKAWNKHDPKAMASQWGEKGDLIDPWGNWASGKNGVEKFFAKDQAGELGKTTMLQTVDTIRFLTPEIAFVDVDAEIKGLTGKDGTQLPPYKHHVVFLISKEKGHWSIFAARPYALQGPLTHYIAN